MFPRLALILGISLTYLSTLPSHAFADDNDSNHITCSSTIDSNQTFAWWTSDHGNNPCKVLLHLLQKCDPDHFIHMMPDSPTDSTDLCVDAPGSNQTASCCCNKHAYALREACWSCQHGATDPTPPNRRPTFGEYLQCPHDELAPFVKNMIKQGTLSVPDWTGMHFNSNDTWSFEAARLAAVKQNNMSMDGGGQSKGGGGNGSQGGGKSDTSNSSPQTGTEGSQPSSSDTSADSVTAVPSAHPSSSDAGAAIAGGILAGLAVVALTLAVFIYVQRRRHRIQEHQERVQNVCKEVGGGHRFCPLQALGLVPPPKAQDEEKHVSPIQFADPRHAPYAFAMDGVARMEAYTNSGAHANPRVPRGRTIRRWLSTARSWSDSLARPPETDIGPNPISAALQVPVPSTDPPEARNRRTSWETIARVTGSMLTDNGPRLTENTPRGHRPEPSFDSATNTHTFSV